MFLSSTSEVEQFVETTRKNLFLLARSLSELGYKFANANGPIQLAGSSDTRKVDELTSHHGPLPFMFSHWYRTFRCVDFSQAASQLTEPNDEPVAGLGLNCALVFLDLDTCLALRQELSDSGVMMTELDVRVFVPFGSACSNCQPKGIWIPDLSIDPVIYDEGAGPVTMASEINNAMRCGGFPFWEYLFRKRRVTSPIANKPDYNSIKPLLVKNLDLF